MRISPATKIHRRPSQAAFSLIELVVAVLIASIMVVSLYAGFTAGFAVLQLARENLRATQILQERMETIRLYNWEQINTAGFVPTNFVEAFFPGTNSNPGLTYTGTIAVVSAPVSEAYSNQLRQVNVDLRWVSAGVLRTRQMRTFVSQYGLQHYVY